MVKFTSGHTYAGTEVGRCTALSHSKSQC